MFNSFQSQTDLALAIARLEPFRLMPRASSGELEGRATYIRQLTKLVADHIEAMAGDAEASQAGRRINESEAQEIAVIGRELAARISNAADERVAA